MKNLIPAQAALPVAYVEALDLADDFAKASKAPATQRAYRSDAAIFAAWCRARGLAPLPATPDTVAAFLADQAATGARPSTLGRRLAAIRYVPAATIAPHATSACAPCWPASAAPLARRLREPPQAT